MIRTVSRILRPTRALVPALLAVTASVFVCATPVIANAQTTTSPAANSRFVGAWRLTFETPTGSSERLLTIMSGGTLLFSGQAVKPASEGAPVTFISAADGSRLETGANTGAMTWIGMVSDGEGKLLAVVTDSVQATISQEGNSWEGSYQATVADPDSNVIYEGEGKVRATRIVVRFPATPVASPAQE